MAQTKEVPANIRQCADGPEQLIYNQLAFLGKIWRATYETNLPWYLGYNAKKPAGLPTGFFYLLLYLNKKRLQRVVVVNGGVDRNGGQCYFGFAFHQVPNLQFDLVG